MKTKIKCPKCKTRFDISKHTQYLWKKFIKKVEKALDETKQEGEYYYNKGIEDAKEKVKNEPTKLQTS